MVGYAVCPALAFTPSGYSGKRAVAIKGITVGYSERSFRFFHPFLLFGLIIDVSPGHFWHGLGCLFVDADPAQQ